MAVPEKNRSLAPNAARLALQAAGYHCPVVTDLGADRSKSQKIKKQMAFEAVNSGDFTHQSWKSMEIYGNGIM